MADKYGNWLGILRWSLAQNDGTHESSFKPMSEENKRWLTKVFNSMTVDEAGRMRDLAEVLSLLPDGRQSALALALRAKAGKPGVAGAASAAAGGAGAGRPAADDEDDEDEGHRTLADDTSAPLLRRKLAALSELLDLVESIDNAKNLFIVGAFPALMQCVVGDTPAPLEAASASGLSGAGAASASAGAAAAAPSSTAAAPSPDVAAAGEFAPVAVQAAAADALATTLQNNPAAQQWALESGALHGLATALARASLRTDALLLEAMTSGPTTTTATGSCAAGAGARAGASAVGDDEDEAPTPEEARAAALSAQLNLQASLLSALSALVRDNGPGQDAMVAGIPAARALSAAGTAKPASAVSAAAAGVCGAGSSEPAADADGEGAFEVDLPAELVGMLRRATSSADAGSSAEAASTPASSSTLRVSPLQLVAHPLLLWPLFCGRVAPSTGSAAAASSVASPVRLLPAGVRAKGRRLVRKCLFFLRHLMQGVSPDSIKAAILCSGPWLALPTAAVAGGAAALRRAMETHLGAGMGLAAASGSDSTSAAAESPSSAPAEHVGGLVPLLLRVLHILPASNTAAASSGAAAAAAAAAGDSCGDDDDDDDGEARDARENALHVLSALTLKSEAGVTVVDETEKRRLGPDGKPMRAPVTSIAVDKPAAAASSASAAAAAAAAEADADMAARRAAGTVASVPTAAATMIAARRAAAAAAAAATSSAAVPASSVASGAASAVAASAPQATRQLPAEVPGRVQQASASSQGTSQGTTAADTASTPAMPLLLMPPPPNSDVEAAAAVVPAEAAPLAASAAGITSAASPSASVPGPLLPPSLTLPQRLGFLLRDDVAALPQLQRFAEICTARAAAARAKSDACAAAAAGGKSVSTASGAGAGAGAGGAPAKAASASSSASSAAAARLLEEGECAAEAAERWGGDADAYAAEGELAAAVAARLAKVAAIMRSVAAAQAKP